MSEFSKFKFELKSFDLDVEPPKRGPPTSSFSIDLAAPGVLNARGVLEEFISGNQCNLSHPSVLTCW